MNVKDKVAVVTGGASGIGLALCTRFAREGAHVVLSDLSQEACERRAAPIGAFPVAADVGREEDIANLVSATIDRFGRIDLFVSNAGIAIDGGIETPTEKWQKIFDVNVMSEVFAAKHVIPHMLNQGGGYLLNTASAEGSPQERHVITTDQLVDIVMEALAEERFMISTHQFVLDKFAIKARDYDEYIRTIRADRAAADSVPV